MKVRIVHVPFYDNTRLWLPGAIVEIASGVAFNGACMEKVEPDSAPPAPPSAPEPVAPQIESRIEPPRIETPTIETPRIKTPTIDSPRIDARIYSRIDSGARYPSGRKKYSCRKVVRPEAPETTTGAPPLVAAPPAADAATPAASLESSRRRLDHSLPLCGVRKAGARAPSDLAPEVPSSHEGEGVDPLRHRETVTPPPLTGEEGDSISSGKTLADPSEPTPASEPTPTSEPTPPSGNESTASPAPSGAEGEGSAAQDTSALPNLT